MQKICVRAFGVTTQKEGQMKKNTTIKSSFNLKFKREATQLAVDYR